MALVDFVAVQSGSTPFAAVRRGLVAWRFARHATREQRLALQSLLFLPQHRMSDLGISRDQLVQAMEIHRK